MLVVKTHSLPRWCSAHQTLHCALKHLALQSQTSRFGQRLTQGGCRKGARPRISSHGTLTVHVQPRVGIQPHEPQQELSGLFSSIQGETVPSWTLHSAQAGALVKSFQMSLKVIITLSDAWLSLRRHSRQEIKCLLETKRSCSELGL